MLHMQIDIPDACKALSVDFKLALMKFLEANILKDNFFFFFSLLTSYFPQRVGKKTRKCGLFLKQEFINIPSEYVSEAQILHRYLVDRLLDGQVVRISASSSVMYGVCGRTKSTVKIIGLLAIL